MVKTNYYMCTCCPARKSQVRAWVL